MHNKSSSETCEAWIRNRAILGWCFVFEMGEKDRITSLEHSVRDKTSAKPGVSQQLLWEDSDADKDPAC